MSFGAVSCGAVVIAARERLHRAPHVDAGESHELCNHPCAGRTEQSVQINAPVCEAARHASLRIGSLGSEQDAHDTTMLHSEAKWGFRGMFAPPAREARFLGTKRRRAVPLR